MAVIEDTPPEEDATKLQFPEVFQADTCDALMISEVFLLLEHRKAQDELKDAIEEVPENFAKALDYSQRFAKFKRRELIRAVRGVFVGRNNMHKFEVAQLANLLPDTADEAKALIPSLETKMGDAELEDLLKDLHDKETLQ